MCSRILFMKKENMLSVVKHEIPLYLLVLNQNWYLFTIEIYLNISVTNLKCYFNKFSTLSDIAINCSETKITELCSTFSVKYLHNYTYLNTYNSEFQP